MADGGLSATKSADRLTKAVFDADQPSPRIERVENVKDLTSYISRIDEMIERKRIFFDNNML